MKELNEEAKREHQEYLAASTELNKLSKPENFTKRENEVLDAAMDGLSVGETAAKLNVSQADIKMFRASLKRKTGLAMNQHIARILQLERTITAFISHWSDFLHK